MAMHIEDAERLIVRWIRERPRTDYPTFGYDVYLSTLIRWHLKQEGHASPQTLDRDVSELWPTFASAAWELCRRGVIRPGIREYRRQATDQGGAGDGYSVTPFGEMWVAESGRDDFVPTEPQRFAQMLVS